MFMEALCGGSSRNGHSWRSQFFRVARLIKNRDIIRAVVGQFRESRKWCVDSVSSRLNPLEHVGIQDRRIAWVIHKSERTTEPVSLEMYPYGIVYHKG